MAIQTVRKAHLARQRDSPAVDVNHAIREVVPVVYDIVHADTFRGRMRL
jgi:hypothetical protein